MCWHDYKSWQAPYLFISVRNFLKYKFTVFLVSVFGFVMLVQTMHKNHDGVAKKNIQQNLVDEQGHPSVALLELLSLTNIEHDGSLVSIVEKTQKPEAEWMRKEGSERWDIADSNVENKDQFFALFDQLNLVDVINPTQQQYDYVLLMGATYFRMKTRLQHAINLFNQGVRFDAIVLLAGARPLTDVEKADLSEDLQDGDAMPTTETEAVKFLYDHAEMPADMRAISMILIDSPMKVTNTGTLTRPTTGDTVDLWMASHPTPGSCLVISNQPYVGYQDSVTKTLLPQTFTVETVGEKSEDTIIGIYLDTLARTLYQEKKRLNL